MYLDVNQLSITYIVCVSTASFSPFIMKGRNLISGNSIWRLDLGCTCTANVCRGLILARRK